jgi:DNA polymerase I-like protein with 3'-5' exonuclease and polymerase domains
MLNKKLSMLTGEKGTLTLMRDDGTIYPVILHNGAVTHRCSHAAPNIAQVPKRDPLWGPLFRALYGAPEGFVTGGADADGADLRMIAHYSAPFDGGRLVDALNGGADPHAENAAENGLDRDQAKGALYAVAYGARARKLSKQLGIPLDHATAVRERIAAKYGFEVLNEKVQGAAKQGRLRGLDGRWTYVREPHAAMNTLIQSATAVFVKFWGVEMARASAGLDWGLLAQLHDEYLVAVRPDHAEAWCGAVRIGMETAARVLNLRVPMRTTPKIGGDWDEVH